MSVFDNIYKNSYDKYECNSFKNSYENYFQLYNIWENAITNSFVWDNLPSSTYITRPEQYLYYRGLMALFVDDENKFKIYPAFPAGALRGDGFYDNYIMYDFAGKNWNRKFEDIELCENCPNQIPTKFIVMYYIEKLKKVLNVIDVQLIKSQGGDIFEVHDESQVNQVLSIWDNMIKNKPLSVILNDDFKNKDINKISLYDSRESQILDMWGIYDKVKNEFMTTLGFNNIQTEKKERLINAEAESNNDVINHGFYETMYIMRLDFCNRVKNHKGWENVEEYDTVKNIICYKNRDENYKDIQKDYIEETVSESEELSQLNDEVNEIDETDNIETVEEKEEVVET